ncbi:hypothetical protein TREMEDRAFT_24726 [Tremella mesenterica DSM 1558]|uniref:uncharacterized protein n=1 Tax=Tremella mesenterica (strain ATCC 24925 / CBS 8224 / DSM 1558 / NBRC 9311 / NRRL Y-6157 / RJB 2259-6 / UBC 559-6) TaxID=578456 RepID=UPI0003F49A72|nr:uncharacterized protein TREMEDRAFT_24726 [Tremella mesenterica DSM 1558]EIW72183.1 hypothetical protein TREMEDRAFT_24726 [Tremella mesenterica DSM 1558]
MLHPIRVLVLLSILNFSLASPPLVHRPREPQKPSKDLVDRRVETVLRRRGDVIYRPRRRSISREKRDVPSLGWGKEVRLERREGKKRWKRDLGNGSIIDLGTTQDTYILPVSIGSSPTTYPVQLDLGSSDLLLASTLCSNTNVCPAPAAAYPFYDVKKYSSTYQTLGGNSTTWRARFGDGTQASGIIAGETVWLGDLQLDGQVFGLINATNLTLSSQQMSGILGLGFPRLSTLSRVILSGQAATSSSSASPSLSSSNIASSSSSTSTSSSPSSTPASLTYRPTVMEHLAQGILPYPVFGLALGPPPVTSSSTSSSASASPSSRYSRGMGLTLGGVSEGYFSNDTASGRTISDIEWHDVVPFGVSFNTSAFDPISSATTSSGSSLTPTSPSSSPTVTSSSGNSRRDSDTSDYPTTSEELQGEEYIFWALELQNISVNGTVITPNSTYSGQGLGSIAILDVGSNGIYGPQQDVERIFSNMQDARVVNDGMWAVPCNTRMTLGFSFGGRYIQLQPSEWMYAQVSGSSFCLAWPMARPDQGDGIDWSFGTPFLRKVYTVFSYGINNVQAPLIGFLPLTSPSSSSTSTSTSSTSSTSPSSNAPSASSITSVDPNSPIPTIILPLSLTQTVQTRLPNDLLPNPSYSTVSYIWSTPTPTPGQLQAQGLGNNSVYTIEDVPIISYAVSSANNTLHPGSTQGDSQPSGDFQLNRGISLMTLMMIVGLTTLSLS